MFPSGWASLKPTVVPFRLDPVGCARVKFASGRVDQQSVEPMAMDEWNRNAQRTAQHNMEIAHDTKHLFCKCYLFSRSETQYINMDFCNDRDIFVP